MLWQFLWWGFSHNIVESFGSIFFSNSFCGHSFSACCDHFHLYSWNIIVIPEFDIFLRNLNFHFYFVFSFLFLPSFDVINIISCWVSSCLCLVPIYLWNWFCGWIWFCLNCKSELGFESISILFPICPIFPLKRGNPNFILRYKLTIDWEAEHEINESFIGDYRYYGGVNGLIYNSLK